MNNQTQYYECCQCGWTGTQEEKLQRADSDVSATHVCPECQCENFYAKKGQQAPVMGPSMREAIYFAGWLANNAMLDGGVWYFDQEIYTPREMYELFKSCKDHGKD